jgi:inositol monophosphatase 3
MSLLNDKADLYLHTSTIFKWDICAPNAILNNRGGKLTRRDGRAVDYSDTRKEALSVNGIIAALHNYNFFYNIFKKTILNETKKN